VTDEQIVVKSRIHQAEDIEVDRAK